MTDPALAFAVAVGTLVTVGHVADHIVQTDHQATHKGRHGRAGQLACLRHVLTYTGTLAAGLLLAAWVTGIDFHPAALIAGLGITAVTHYWADRRVYLERAARRILGKGGWIDHDSTALYHLDQSWHMAWFFLASLVMCIGA